MRTANRSLVLVLAFLVSVIAAPTYAADDSPGLLNAIDTAADSLTAHAPGPAPAVAPQAAASVKQVATVLDSALVGQTSLGELPLVSTVEEVLSGSAALPADPLPGTGSGNVDENQLLLGPAASAAGDGQVLASRPLTTVLQRSSFSASAPAKGAKSAEEAHIPGTSTLPDGGSPLTLAWLVLWFAVTGAGAIVLRRART